MFGISGGVVLGDLKVLFKPCYFCWSASMIIVSLDDHVKPNSRKEYTAARWGWLDCKAGNIIEFGRSSGLSMV